MRRTAIDNSPQPNCQTPTQMPIKTGRLINNYHCKRNGLNMGEINIIYCQLDSGSEEQRQKGLHLCFPLSSAALCSFTQDWHTSHPEQQGLDSRGSCDRSRTAPLHSSCLPTVPPALEWAFSHGMQSFRKTKMLKHGLSIGCGSFRSSPPASVLVPPSVLYLWVGCFSHPLPLLSYCRFLWNNPLLGSTESNTALIWVCGSEP